jgi:hypothetical protein
MKKLITLLVCNILLSKWRQLVRKHIAAPDPAEQPKRYIDLLPGWEAYVQDRVCYMGYPGYGNWLFHGPCLVTRYKDRKETVYPLTKRDYQSFYASPIN